MSASLVSIFGLILALSELGLALFKRANSDASRAVDRGSLRLLWLVILLSIGGAFAAVRLEPAFGFGPQPSILAGAIALFACGLSLRWFSILYLGKFFTVNVAIAEHHRLVDTGPYKYIRHPSYTGILMEFTAMGIAFCNWGSLAVMTVPTLVAFLWRIRIEEAALLRGLGSAYVDYVARTKRLVPSLY